MIQEPVLMQYQNGPFNCDPFITEEFLNLKNKFNIRFAIETGTCLGFTAKWLSENFDYVQTVEINKEYRDFALERLRSIKNVNSWLGDSPSILRVMLNTLTDNTIIFLDAHWGENCPLKDELSVIAEKGLKPCIAIHDFVVPNKPEFGYDSINGQAFTFEWLKPNFDAIYGVDNYDHYYNTGLHEESAKRGIIYITPKVKTYHEETKLLTCGICGYFCDNAHHSNNWFDPTLKKNQEKVNAHDKRYEKPFENEGAYADEL